MYAPNAPKKSRSTMSIGITSGENLDHKFEQVVTSVSVVNQFNSLNSTGNFREKRSRSPSPEK
jgi:hypothetical protein